MERVWRGYYPFIHPLYQGVLPRYIMGASPPSKSHLKKMLQKKISIETLVFIFVSNFANFSFFLHYYTIRIINNYLYKML